jgi:hypothetical protein
MEKPLQTIKSKHSYLIKEGWKAIRNAGNWARSYQDKPESGVRRSSENKSLNSLPDLPTNELEEHVAEHDGRRVLELALNDCEVVSAERCEIKNPPKQNVPFVLRDQRPQTGPVWLLDRNQLVGVGEAVDFHLFDCVNVL